MHPLASPLPVAVARRGELTGLLAGVACFPSALFAGLFIGLVRAPIVFAIPILLATVCGAFVAALVTPTAEATGIPGATVRVGFRAGIIAGIVAGSMEVLASTLHSFGFGVPPSIDRGWGPLGVLVPPVEVPRVAIVCVLTLLPSLFFALSGAMVGGVVMTPPRPAYPIAVPVANGERSTIFGIGLLIALVCYLSPSLLVLKAAPKLKPVTIVPPVPIAAPQPPLLKWRYTLPSSFGDSPPSRVVIMVSQDVGTVSEEQPVAMSPDGLRLCYCTKEGNWKLHFLNLETFDPVSVHELSDAPEAVSWAPDSRSVLVTTSSKARTLIVIQLEPWRVIYLPKPNGLRTPAGRPTWWREHEVLFTNMGKTYALLNLENLRVLQPDSSEEWRGLSESSRESLSAGTERLPSTLKWGAVIASRIRQYDVPNGATDSWNVSSAMHLSLCNKGEAYNTSLGDIEAQIGDRFEGARDGSKIVRIRNNAAKVFYLGLRPDPPLEFEIKMPAAPDPARAQEIEKLQVCAFVCSPLVNPLNSVTVGPDRNRVKGIARLKSWSATDATWWIDTDQTPVELGDVIADLHTWTASKPVSFGDFVKNEWFAVIDNSSNSPALPAATVAAPLDRTPKVVTQSSRGALRFTGLEQPPESKPPAPPPPPAPSPSEPAQPAPNVEATNQQSFVLRQFIFDHHIKASRGDVEGLARDYADSTIFMDHGTVNRDFIRKDEAAYHAPGSKVTEEIVSMAPIQLQQGNTEVSYQISFFRQTPNRKWTRGLADITVKVHPTSSGWEIVEQHVKIKEKQQSP